MKLGTFVLLSPLALSGPAMGGFEGLTAELKPNDLGILTWCIYAQFDETEGQRVLGVTVSAAFPAAVTVVGGTFYQSPFGGDLPPNPLVCQVFPSTCFDTFVTIGATTSVDDSTILAGGWPGFPPDSLELSSSGWVIGEPSSPQSEPDENNRVLLMQLSTQNGTGFRGFLRVEGNNQFMDYAAFDTDIPCTFAPDIRFDAGSEPRSIALGDLDGDQDLDLAVSDESIGDGGDVSVLLNNGDGTFAAAVTVDYPAAGYVAWSIASGDLDGDADLDLAVVNSCADSVSLLLNNGAGTFAPGGAIQTGSLPGAIVLGDLDGDLDLDLAIVNVGGDDVSILLNNGDGTFPADVVHPVGEFPQAVCAGDLDGDADLDLAVVNSNDDNVRVLLNSGGGSFAPGAVADVGELPESIAAGDLDGDLDLDLVVGNSHDDTVSVLLNDGDATFAASVTAPAGDGPTSVALGDIDGDGRLDLAVAKGRGTVAVLLNDGDGTLAAPFVHGAGDGAACVAIGDVDGDGDTDLLVTGSNFFDPIGHVSVFLRQCTGDACPWDLDGNAIVGITDVLDLLANWGRPYGINDLLDLLAAWGLCD